MNKRENPIINSPIERRLLLPEKISGMAIPLRGRAKMLISTANPRNEIIHTVIVVPMFAPIITEMACVRESRPALTKLTTITVVAEDDCIRAVINKPVQTPAKRLVVMADKIVRILLPATFCNPSLIIFIPYKKSPREPTSFKKSKNE